MLGVAYVVDEWVTLSQTFIREEVAELRRQGVRVEVVALEHGDARPNDHEPAVFLADVLPPSPAGRAAALIRHPLATVRLMGAQRRMQPERIRYRATLPAVADRLRALEVQWVHAHFGWEAAGVAEALAAMLGLGWSFTAHANDIFVANEHLAGKLARADRLVTVCTYNLEQLQATFGALPPTEVVVCGVDVPPLDAKPAPAEVDVLAVGRLVPKKGFDLLVQAATELRASHPDLQVEIVGDGPERSALDALVEEHDLGDVVTLLGPRDHAWVLERMAAARVVCLPARIAADGDRDSMPVVLKEAMARAIPVRPPDRARGPSRPRRRTARGARRPRPRRPARSGRASTGERALHARRRGRSPPRLLRALVGRSRPMTDRRRTRVAPCGC
jgi:colanic acid/amylovoran biosynthesis glycosyltransferase